ncbi:MAG: hypothetical protein B7Z37_14270 [Verrucomicrobia bacterium 12-59-8]|nr:MAG: hypothetical protein B7Z37_14270 [Verrucomicrobia bacterium 12-59-8]
MELNLHAACMFKQFAPKQAQGLTKLAQCSHKKSPEVEPPGFEIESASGYFFLAGVAQQALAEVLAAGVQQEVQVSFFLAKMQWPLAQLLSRRLVETRARVRSDFIMMWCGCLGLAEAG